VFLVASQIRVAGEVSELLAAHRRLSGPRRDPATLPAGQDVIEESHTDKQTSLLIRTTEPVRDPAWAVTPVSLEDLVIAYMNPANVIPARRPQLGVVS
jgi:ABC-2 type transport system ATP-binding protein